VYCLSNFEFKVTEREGNRIAIYPHAISNPKVGETRSDYSDGADMIYSVVWCNLRALKFIRKNTDGEWSMNSEHSGYSMYWIYSFDGDKLDIDKLVKFPLDKIKKSIENKLDDFYRAYKRKRKYPEIADPDADRFVKYLKYFIDPVKVEAGLNQRSFIKEAYKKQCEMLDEMFDSFKRQQGHSDISWRTIDPGSQLTGSFNPLYITEKEWYGDLYKE
jgi:hypothetical protein